MTTDFSPERSDAIRESLERTVTEAPTRAGRARHAWLPGAALLVVGLVAGGAVSAAAVTSLQPDDAHPAIAAPPGVQPGQPIISLLGSTTPLQVEADATVELPEAPAGATHLRVAFSCERTGSITVGPDVGGNNPGSTCDAPGTSGAAWFDFDLKDVDGTLTIRITGGGRGFLSLQYVNYVPTALATNPSGETYGVENNGVVPDLVSVFGEAADGTPVEGYARSTDLSAFGPDWPEQPSNPEETVKWQAERDERYPNGWDIDVFTSDGHTKVGTFHIGG